MIADRTLPKQDKRPTNARQSKYSVFYRRSNFILQKIILPTRTTLNLEKRPINARQKPD